MTAAILAIAATMLTSCGSGSARTADSDSVVAEVSVPAFNADSAYAYTAMQTAFGPRVPGTQAHAQCREWLVQRLEQTGADTVIVQRGMMADADNRPLAIYNIFAQFNAKATRRLLLLAHYDSRPWADEDPNPANRQSPIDGANDGASGVAVILEIARLVGLTPPGIGIDVLFADAEDGGRSNDADPQSDLTWCLGSQYFANHLPYAGSLPEGAFLLDMVGGSDAAFPVEYFSQQAAPQLIKHLQNSAAKAGVSGRFPSRVGGAVNDDHVHIISAGIPAVDIIEIDHPRTGSFNPTWHTKDDNIGNISRETLGDVGRALVTAIYTY